MWEFNTEWLVAIWVMLLVAAEVKVQGSFNYFFTKTIISQWCCVMPTTWLSNFAFSPFCYWPLHLLLCCLCIVWQRQRDKVWSFSGHASTDGICWRISTNGSRSLVCRNGTTTTTGEKKYVFIVEHSACCAILQNCKCRLFERWFYELLIISYFPYFYPTESVHQSGVYGS